MFAKLSLNILEKDKQQIVIAELKILPNNKLLKATVASDKTMPNKLTFLGGTACVYEIGLAYSHKILYLFRRRKK
jgi:hypothetical protein